MPNHIANRITGPSIAEIKDLLRGPHSAVDFNRLIPMPEILRHTISGPSTVRWCENPSENDYKKRVERDATPAEIQEILNTGYRSWYEWSIAKWGTKWNAYAIEDRPDALYFETAWAMPEPILNALADALPKSTFTWEYADEDYGENLGIRKYSDGAMWTGKPRGDLQEWAMRLHGRTDEQIAEYRAEIAADKAETC